MGPWPGLLPVPRPFDHRHEPAGAHNHLSDA